jgi:hypothetical protein
MQLKSILITAGISLGTLLAYEHYKSRRQG